MVVILSEAKNLIISTESIIEILRLSPQNDITTQSLDPESSLSIFIAEDHGREPVGESVLIIPPTFRGRSGGGLKNVLHHC